MHIPENYLSPATCAVMGAAMVPVWVHTIKKVNRELPKDRIPFLGVGAAFSFLGMMFNVPLIGGTTGHAVGGTLVALLVGPDAACIAVSVALLLQAVIFGDGGILSFGANCFNMAFVLPYTGYAIYQLIMRLCRGKKTDGPVPSGKEERLPSAAASGEHARLAAGTDERNRPATRIQLIAAAAGGYIGINAAALCAAIEFGIQPLLFTDAAGQALYCPYGLSVSIPAMMVPHLLVAGFVEAAFTAAIYAFVKKTAPDLTYENMPAAGHHVPVFVLLAVLVAATPLGLLATGTAWGEWGAEEIADIAADGSILGYTPQGLAEGWSLQTLLPDYTAGEMNETAAYILSAVIGAALLIILFKLISILVKGNRRHDS